MWGLIVSAETHLMTNNVLIRRVNFTLTLLCKNMFLTAVVEVIVS